MDKNFGKNFPIKQSKPENINSNFSKEGAGEKFKEFLKNNADHYDQNLFETAKGVAGEEYALAIRNMVILTGSLKNLIEIPNFPTRSRQFIQSMLFSIQNNDPTAELMKYHDAKPDLDKVAHYGRNYNEKSIMFLHSIKGLLEHLRNILPDSMVDELIARSSMFAQGTLWVDEIYNKKFEK